MSISGDRMPYRALALAGALWLAAACGGAGPEQRLQQAIAHEASGRHQAAILELRNALQQDPDLAEARLRLGLLFLRAGDAAAAVVELERARRLGVSGAEIDEALARARVASGAARHAQAVVTAYGGDDPAKLSDSIVAALGTARLLLGQHEQARDLLTALVERAPDSVEARLALARVEFEHDDLTGALKHGEVAARLDPDSWEAAVLLGELELASGDPHSARKHFLTAESLAAERGVTTTRSRLGLARALMATNEFSAARPVLDDALAVAPDLPPAQYLRALVHLEEQEPGEARRLLEQVLRVVPDHQDSRYFLALIAFREGRHSQARDALERMVTRTPGNLRARILLAAVHHREARHDRAVEVLQAGLRVPGVEPDAAYYLALGNSLIHADDQVEGIEMLARAAAAAPDSAAVRTRLALAQLATGATSRGEAELLEAVNLSQEFPLSETLLVFVQIEAERFGEAVATAEQFVARSPDLAVAHNMLGAARLADGDRTGARQAWNDALELDPGFSPASVNLAALERQEGNRLRARDLLETALRKNPDHPTAHRSLAELAYEEGDLDAALRHISDAWDRNRNDPTLSLRKAELLSRRGHPERALEVLGRLGADDSVSDRILAARVRAGLQTERPVAALSPLEALLSRHPDDGPTRALLAEVQIRLGELDAAVREYEKLRLQSPDNPVLLNNLAWLYGRTGHPEAIATARRAYQLAPDMAPIQDTLGQLLLADGGVTEAVDLLRRAADASPDDPQIQYHFALALERSGAHAEARDVLTSGAVSRDFDSADDARALLERLGE